MNHSFKADWRASVFDDYNCVWLRSTEVSRKRQSQEERDYGETPQEKKLRLAKLYLDQLKEEGKPRATHTHTHTGIF